MCWYALFVMGVGLGAFAAVAIWDTAKQRRAIRQWNKIIDKAYQDCGKSWKRVCVTNQIKMCHICEDTQCSHNLRYLGLFKVDDDEKQ